MTFENLGQEINFNFLTMIFKVLGWVSGKARIIGEAKLYIRSMKNTVKVKYVLVL